MDYLTELNLRVECERRELERLRNRGAPRVLVEIQRKHVAEVSDQLENLKDYYCVGLDHGASI